MPLNMYSALLIEFKSQAVCGGRYVQNQTEDEDRRLGGVGCHDGSMQGDQINQVTLNFQHYVMVSTNYSLSRTGTQTRSP